MFKKIKKTLQEYKTVLLAFGAGISLFSLGFLAGNCKWIHRPGIEGMLVQKIIQLELSTIYSPDYKDEEQVRGYRIAKELTHDLKSTLYFLDNENEKLIENLEYQISRFEQ